MQVRQEGEKIYGVLFSKVAMVKNLTKANETLQTSCAMKVCNDDNNTNNYNNNNGFRTK